MKSDSKSFFLFFFDTFLSLQVVEMGVDEVPALAAVSASSTPTSTIPAIAAPSSMFGSLAQNQLFSAGVGVAGLGIGFALMKQGALRASLMAQRYLTVSLEIPSKDRSYQW